MTIHFSHIRDDICTRKKIHRDTGWKSGEMAPRFGLYPVTRPAQSRWEWRCLNLEGANGLDYRVLIEVSPAFGKWKAMLIKIPDSGAPVAICRLEDQPGTRGGGLHIHAHCDLIGEVSGASSVEMPYTLPEHGQKRRRRLPWTKPQFCHAVGRAFRTDTIVGQEELDL